MSSDTKMREQLKYWTLNNVLENKDTLEKNFLCKIFCFFIFPQTLLSFWNHVAWEVGTPQPHTTHTHTHIRIQCFSNVV